MFYSIIAFVEPYCLAALVPHEMKTDGSGPVYQTLQIPNLSPTATPPPEALFNKSNFNDDNEPDGVYELTIFDF